MQEKQVSGPSTARTGQMNTKEDAPITDVISVKNSESRRGWSHQSECISFTDNLPASQIKNRTCCTPHLPSMKGVAKPDPAFRWRDRFSLATSTFVCLIEAAQGRIRTVCLVSFFSKQDANSTSSASIKAKGRWLYIPRICI